MTAKRKKTTDMPDSPPKRVTRARAKAVGETKTKITAKAPKVTTGAKKSATEKIEKLETLEKATEKATEKDAAVAKPRKTTKRKTRADDVDDKAVDSPQPVVVKISAGRAKAGDSKKSAIVEGNADDKPAPPKTRGRPKRLAVDTIEGTVDEPPKPRGRSKRVATKTTNPKVEEPDEIEVEAKAKRTTRARTTPSSTGTIAKKAKPNAIKKKVTFKDEIEQEKENQPLVTEITTKAMPKSTGLRAKPIRKPAAAKGTSRGKTVQNDGIEPGDVAAVQPLSPKKDKQVAKTSSSSSEDELNGAKTPIRSLSKSPMKPPTSIRIGTGTKGVSKIDFGHHMAPVSPTKMLETSVLGTPARRPPPSPFKDSLKVSPKKINIQRMIPQPALQASKTPLKASLLQSPARRPAPSPFVSNTSTTSGKPSVSRPVITQSSTTSKAKTSELPVFSPQKNITGELRRLISPDRSAGPCTVSQTKKLEQTAVIGSEAPSDVFSDHASSTEDISKCPTTAPIAEVDIRSCTETQCKTPLVVHSTPASEGSEQEQSKVTNLEVSPQSKTDEGVESEQTVRSTTPPGPASPSGAFSLQSPEAQYHWDESDSEDELQCANVKSSPTIVNASKIWTKDSGSTESLTTRTMRGKPGVPRATADNSMTPLALQLGNWLAASPEKEDTASSKKFKGIFSPSGDLLLPRPTQDLDSALKKSPSKPTFFEDEMSISRQQDEDSGEGQQADSDAISIQLSQESEASEEFGDENAIPIDPQLLTMNVIAQASRLTCTPAKVFSQGPRVIHTVSKVPLKPEGDDSPLKVPRKRGRSLSGMLSARKELQLHDSHRSDAVGKPSITAETLSLEYSTPTRPGSTIPPTPVSGTWSTAGTPARTPRRGLDADILKGAIVYVDVHTSEGADASGIFVELLAQMGARCVKQWPWNPRASGVNSNEGKGSGRDISPETSQEASTPGGKVGITHVIFKDGGKRTMEKVRESNGVVLCVGVAWVLEYVSCRTVIDLRVF